MVVYILVLVFIAFLVFWLIMTMPPQKGAFILTNAGPIVLMVIGGLLTLFRRGAIGIPLLVLGLTWWRRSRALRPLSTSEARTSTVRSANLEMVLDHDSGEMDGRVLTGSMTGTRLSSLNEMELLELYREIRGDADSAALLESFLDRYHPDWGEHEAHSSSRERSGASGFAAMTKEEAYQVLGLGPGASKEEIHQAWRRLVKAVHPDSGGSAFLAAKINAARDLLLK